MTEEVKQYRKTTKTPKRVKDPTVKLSMSDLQTLLDVVKVEINAFEEAKNDTKAQLNFWWELSDKTKPVDTRNAFYNLNAARQTNKLIKERVNKLANISRNIKNVLANQ